MAQLGANAFGEVLEPGRVPDCYLGLPLHDADSAEAAGVLIVSPAALLHPSVPQPDGTLLHELLTGHPDQTAHELVFVADLTVQLRAWPTDTWANVGVDPQAAVRAVVTGWRRGDLTGLPLGGLTGEEALALERPAMTYVREQLGGRLQRQLGRAYRRWLHPTSGRRPGDRFLSQWTSTGCEQRRGRTPAVQPSGRHHYVAAVPEPSGHYRSVVLRTPDAAAAVRTATVGHGRGLQRHRQQPGRPCPEAMAVRAPEAVPARMPKEPGSLGCASTGLGWRKIDTSVRPARIPDAPSDTAAVANTCRSGRRCPRQVRRTLRQPSGQSHEAPALSAVITTGRHG